MDVERLIYWVPRVYVEDLVREDVLVIGVEAFEEFCVEVVVSDFIIVEEGGGNS